MTSTSHNSVQKNKCTHSNCCPKVCPIYMSTHKLLSSSNAQVHIQIVLIRKNK